MTQMSCPYLHRLLRSILICLLVLLLFTAGPGMSQETLSFPDGVLSGDVTDSRTLIWARTSAPASVRVEYGVSQALGEASGTVRTASQTDFTAKIDLVNLRSGTRYYYRATAEQNGQRAASLVGTFRTAPTAGETADLTFVWGADTGERFKPFRIFDAIRSQNPDFFLFLGDTIYSDTDCSARTVPEYRACYRWNRDDEPFQRLARVTSIDAIWDDHEVANNFDRTHERIPQGREAFIEYWPIRTDPAEPTQLYRSFRWGRLVELFILDTRQYRSPEFDRDTPRKTMLGGAQKEWLKQGLRNSDAAFKIIATTVPLKYHGVDSWEGYTTERQELFDFIVRNNIRRVIFLSGDVHYAAVLRYREGFVEAIAGPLAQIINRRRNVAGEPETEFSFNASFTFGLVRVAGTPPALAIEIYDVEGRQLHRTIVQP